MRKTIEQKNKISETVKKFGGTTTNSGSTHVQVALLTQKINELNQHFGTHKKDHQSRRGLLVMVGQRRRLLNYLRKSKPSEYQQLLQSLELRK